MPIWCAHTIKSCKRALKVPQAISKPATGNRAKRCGAALHHALCAMCVCVRACCGTPPRHIVSLRLAQSGNLSRSPKTKEGSTHLSIGPAMVTRKDGQHGMGRLILSNSPPSSTNGNQGGNGHLERHFFWSVMYFVDSILPFHIYFLKC